MTAKATFLKEEKEEDEEEEKKLILFGFFSWRRLFFFDLESLLDFFSIFRGGSRTYYFFVEAWRIYRKNTEETMNTSSHFDISSRFDEEVESNKRSGRTAF